jgi:saccharopine dehydrogenase-like NADP-dependent oxidoreductase
MPTPTKVLVLGAGLVARPLIRYLLEHGFEVTCASRTVSKADALVDGHPLSRALPFNVKDLAALDALVAECDIAISLLPATMHVEVARACLRHRKHMGTTSYISPAMRALHAEAEAAGLLFINECGVDPGIDHMSAMRIFDDIWGRGGKVEVFKSYCGGLPAPEANNRLGYKFSWAPRGVLVAATNNARYLWDGKVVEVPGGRLLADNHPLTVGDAGTFEAYPNRDSLSYEDVYGLHGLTTLFRGTLRYPGHCARWQAWIGLGLYNQEPVAHVEHTRAGMLRAVLGVGPGADLAQAVADRLGVPVDHDHVANLGWLGMYEEIPLSDWIEAPLDALAEAMVERMPYAPGERDMLVMHHEVVGAFPDGHRERIVMDMVDYGHPGGDSSMARTVSLPLAIAVRLLFTGQIGLRGVWAPVRPELYTPVLDELETLDIVCAETKELL